MKNNSQVSVPVIKRLPRYHRYLEDKEYVTGVYKAGAENASRIAYKTLKKVYRKVGFVNKEW